jgi:hypothetical protein
MVCFNNNKFMTVSPRARIDFTGAKVRLWEIRNMYETETIISFIIILSVTLLIIYKS